MRVTHLLLDDRVGGMENFVRYLDPAMSALGVHADHIALDTGEHAGAVSRRSDRVLGLRRRIKASRPDVLFAHSALPSVYARLVAPRGLRVVSVIHSGGDDFTSAKLRLAERLLLRRRTAAVVAVSQTVADRYRARFPQIGDRLFVVPNGVPAAAAPRRREGLRRIVTVARVVRQKNIDVLLDAVETIDATVWGDIVIDVLGPPAEADYAAAMAERVESSDVLRTRVVFRGAVDGVAARLTDYDAMVHPSPFEGLSIALLEAAQAGLPIVAAEPVLREFGGTVRGTTFTPGDASSLAEALVALVERFDEKAAVAADQVAAVDAAYGIDHAAREYLAVAVATAEGLKSR